VTHLRGARVALLESRMTSTLSSLVQLYGGQPYAVPALRESPVASNEVDRLTNGIARGRFSVVIFQTGVAAQLLFDEAANRGKLDEVQDRLRRCTTVCRGPKPAAVLSRQGIRPTVNVSAPFTTQELTAALSLIELDRKYVALLHYGERNAPLGIALRTRGARLAEFLLYEWCLPDDLGPLRTLVQEIIGGNVDAIAFTNQIQIRHLLAVAGDMHLAEELAQALTQRLVVASIGPSCTLQLRKLGIQPRVMPSIPKMRPLISSLSDYFRFAAFQRTLPIDQHSAV
jgi:uroporphyrinogen-III synthase